ncbi:MAG: ABC transporter substrate-binding protein, partial [Candidatus Methanomethylophilaceae archaeon]|nr:ABC transporter substrate-binding protein [Candidatus Methanomethylophilaceae archaeon]
SYDETLKSRPGWDQIDAVKNDQVYYISNDICGGMRSVVGAMFALSLYNDAYSNFDVMETMNNYNKIAGTSFDTDLVWNF